MSAIQENYSLKSLNTFGVEASSRYYISVTSESELRDVIALPAVGNLPKLIIGGGSNLLLTQDFPGLVIHVNLKGKRIVARDADATYVEAAAGENWHEFVCWTLAQNLAGLENLSLIPGTVGAAPIQNIGAYGVELQDTFHALTALDLISGELQTFDCEACRFDYRDSVFKREFKDRVVITSVTFRLPHRAPLRIDYGDVQMELAQMNIKTPTARNVGDAVINIRRRKLPDPAMIGNAGSFFKNPIITDAEFTRLQQSHPNLAHYTAQPGHVKIPAGWLIEQTGWKGKHLGRAGVHAQHALVLVNLGGASGAEILALAQIIQRAVRDQFAIALEPEPVII